jgi:segregation and condensation protein B
MKRNQEKFSAFELYDSLINEKPSIKTCIEGILFISDTPVKVSDISLILKEDKKVIIKTIEELSNEYLETNRGFIIRKSGNGYRMYSNPALNDILKHFVSTTQKVRITQAALETLAIIAYKQPITRSQISEIRGVKTDSIVINLVSKGLIKEAGRLKIPGNPIIYKTTTKFLEILGINSLDDLPKLNLEEH